MKAVSEWFWMATGIICGMIIFTIAYLQITEVNRKNIEQKSIEQFKEIENIVDNLCKSFVGNKREYSVSLSENIEGIYVASSKYEEYEGKELEGKILEKDLGKGNFLCIKVKDKILECKELECDTTMPFIGSVPEEFSLSALVNKLTGRGKIFDYYLEFERMRDNVEVKFKTEKPVEKLCTGILNIKSSGNDACTITATISVIGCKEKEWKIKDDENIKCNGVVYKDVYTEECTWNINTAGEDDVFVYELYIDEKIKDSKSVKCPISGPKPTECSPDKLVKKVDKILMFKNIEYLTQHNREYKSSGNKKTADYIKNKLEEYGLSNVHFEDFSSGDGRNVVGEIGSGETTIVVTGGHRDAVASCPGAVDNAAGTATVLEAARVIASCKDDIRNYKIKFVLFDGEEKGLYGSYAYVNAHSSESINRMLNFDCLGLKGNQGLTVFRTATDLSNSADKACQFLGITCEKKGQAPSYSDHAPFGEKGIGYLFAINYGATCGTCYHCVSCQDDMTQIDNTKLEEAGKFAVYILTDLYVKKNGVCNEASCSSWSNQGCELGGCNSGKMYQKRTCTDTNCRELTRCVDDQQCSQSKCKTVVKNGNSEDKLDVVFVGHGYTDTNLQKFINDVNAHKNSILSLAPFDTDSSKINFYRVEEFRDLGCAYNCNGIERLICCDNTKVKNLASQCPVDQIIVLVNNDKYGGAGYLCAGVAVAYRVIDGGTFNYGVTVHEFGHSFGCLNDHYDIDPNCVTYHCHMCSAKYTFASTPCNCLQTIKQKLNAYR